MKYIAHLREDGQEQPLQSHLRNVAELASEYAHFFGGEKEAYKIGLLHDIGKYAKTSQYHMQHPDTTPPCDHSTAGAQAAVAVGDRMGAFAIAGHHGGLPDIGTRLDSSDSPTLSGRIKRKVEDSSAWKNEIVYPGGNQKSDQPAWLDPKNGLEVSFYIRMLFSCLVDADYIDTEQFMGKQDVQRGNYDTAERLLARLTNRTSAWINDPRGDLNQSRSDILQKSYEAGKRGKGMFTMTVPTGGGKTTASLAFALSHAVHNRIKRIIYVIPYTSIIEQNAEVFRGLLGEQNILEHHCNVDSAANDPMEAKRMDLATENWDIPVVVTTAVQFFESIFANRPSRCRKNHNITDSVIIMDEAQMMPLKMLYACVGALTELVSHYETSVVLCTATQPALNDVIKEFNKDLWIEELIPQELCNRSIFQRTVLKWEGGISHDRLIEKLYEVPQVLCIVNTKKEARIIHALLPEEGSFHLSTWMTPVDRKLVLNEVKERLRTGLPCRVVSTSLIECGVDVDFPVVWREIAGLDSILQAAGRCNREGKRNAEESVVHIFSTSSVIPEMFRLQCAALEYTRESYEDRMQSSEAVTCYFSQLRYLMGKERMDIKNILERCAQFQFKKVSEEFKMIDSETVPMYIDIPENHEMIEKLRSGVADRMLFRKLSQWTVMLYPNELAKLLGEHPIKDSAGDHVIARGTYADLIDDRFAILTNSSLYQKSVGLQLNFDESEGLFV